MVQYTPMIQQYLAIKAQYQDAFLFFRLGDFYEMFFEDAVKASQELEITLTSRDGGGSEKIPMCGVPHHSADNYISQLVSKGYKVAICEQTEDPKQAKGVVKREVVQMITPGTIMKDNVMNDKENNYISTVEQIADHVFGIAFCDLSTGESKVTLIDGDWEEVIQELYVSGAKEIVLTEELALLKQDVLKERLHMTISIEHDSDIHVNDHPLISKLVQLELKQTVARLFNYLNKTQKRSLDHLQPVEYYVTNHYMKIDMYSKRNLELTETIRSSGRKGSLIWLLDKTVTAMGGRMLKNWIERPLINKQQISARHGVVETFIEHFFEREELREKLREVYDLERLAGRVAYGTVNARDLVQLKRSLQQVPAIIDIISKLGNPYTAQLIKHIDPCEQVVELLESGLIDNPPLSVKEGGMIKDGFNKELDTYRDATKNGKRWIAELEQQERELTGIKSLKVGYNRVFGYYLEVTRANLKHLPEGRYERKQTLTNAERFITPELKEKEALILEAEERSVELEYDLFNGIREQVKAYIPKLQQLAKVISELDVLQCFAVVSEERQYCKPTFNDEGNIRILNGRHPVVEKVMNSQEYVANDLIMHKGRELLLITGPNMSGKSTYMRQLALIAILAQIGCFVPAEEAELPIFDQVFTRIGAADDLVSGQSTFMVEMLEAKNAITKATKNSLILLDEIGRGTSTYDGMALAQAIIEYIHEEIGAKTLFSTHYHELTELEHTLANLKNVHVSAIEEKGNVVFLHKVKEGQADKSYGIHVAQLAGLPEKIITRARTILTAFEQGEMGLTQSGAYLESSSISEASSALETAEELKETTDQEQLSFFAESTDNNNTEQKKRGKAESKALEMLENINLLEMTPLDAMNKLYEIQKTLKK